MPGLARSRPNHLFQAAREARPSSAGLHDLCMSRRELAEAANSYVWSKTNGREHTNLSEHDIGRYERGEVRWPGRWRRFGLRGVLGATSDAELGFYPNRQVRHRRAAVREGDSGAAHDTDGSTYAIPPPTSSQLALANALDSDGTIQRIAALLAWDRASGHTPSPDGGHLHPDRLVASAAVLKRDYQAGRYVLATKALPRLLWAARALCVESSDGSQLALAASVYQTACSVLLKLDEPGVALLAAHQSVAAADRSGDPVAAGASARALVHALASNHHRQLAITVALDAAERIRPSGGSVTMADVAVYGALLLRASVIAAADEDGATAKDLLMEAGETACRIEGNDNHYWTYFCSTNVQLHRVSVAATLRNAGQAIEYARQVNPELIPLAERRARFYVDLSRAYLQWDKYDRAYEALRAAEQIAPEEVAVRPWVHGVVAELQRRCPPSMQSHITQLAQRLRAVQ